MMTKHKMNLFCGMLLLSASLFVEKAQAMFPERYVSEESAARADTINFRLASAGEAKRLIAAKDSYTANWSPFDIAARLENPEGKEKTSSAWPFVKCVNGQRKKRSRSSGSGRT